MNKKPVTSEGQSSEQTSSLATSDDAAGSPSSTPEMDSAAYEATTRTVGKWIVPLAKARKMERQRTRLLRIAESYIDDLDDSGDLAGAKVIRRWVQDILSDNVKEHAPSPAGASVETGGEG